MGEISLVLVQILKIPMQVFLFDSRYYSQKPWDYSYATIRLFYSTPHTLISNDILVAMGGQSI